MLFTVISTNGFYSPPPPLKKKWFETIVWNVNIVYGNPKSENSQGYAQKPQRNCGIVSSWIWLLARSFFKKYLKNTFPKKVYTLYCTSIVIFCSWHLLSTKYFGNKLNHFDYFYSIRTPRMVVILQYLMFILKNNLYF